MKLSIVIPSYNEAGRIASTLDEVASFFASRGLDFETLVVDDGSTDGTSSKAAAWAENNGRSSTVTALRIEHAGKGAAVARGVMAAHGDVILMMDADLATPLEEWDKLSDAIASGAQVAIGSRQAPGATIERRQPWLRQRLGLLFGAVARSMFPMGVRDSQCGFKAFKAEAARELFRGLAAKGFCFDVEVLLRARVRGMSVVEVPVRWHDDPDSSLKIWRDWFAVVVELVKIRRAMKDYAASVSKGESKR